MDRVDKIVFGISLGAVLSLILVVGFRLFKSQTPPEKPKHEIGECYVVGNNWFKIEIVGKFGAVVENVIYKRKNYITFEGLKTASQFDCDLIGVLDK